MQLLLIYFSYCIAVSFFFWPKSAAVILILVLACCCVLVFKFSLVFLGALGVILLLGCSLYVSSLSLINIEVMSLSLFPSLSWRCIWKKISYPVSKFLMFLSIGK